MTKKGYTHIQVPLRLYQTLKQLSKDYNLSMAKLIELLLENSSLKTSLKTQAMEEQNCSLNKQDLNELKLNNQDSNLFSKNGVEIKGKIIRNRKVSYICGSTRARSKGQGSEPCGIGLRGFKSHLPH